MRHKMAAEVSVEVNEAEEVTSFYIVIIA